MADRSPSLGESIDQLIAALEPLDEASRKTALSAVCAHLGISLTSPLTPAATSPAQNPQAHPPSNPAPPTPQIDIRSLKDQKKPKSAKEMACIVAYYLQEHAPESERKAAVTMSDMEKYFKQAGYKLPSRIQQLLVDGKASGYFDSGGRGEYKLNAVGYNLVAHTLPRDTGD